MSLYTQPLLADLAMAVLEMSLGDLTRIGLLLVKARRRWHSF